MAARKPVPPPEPTGWLTTADAAERLGRTTTNIKHLLKMGLLEGQKVRDRHWIRESSVQALIDERAPWVSIMEAAKIIGCGHATVSRHVAAGNIAHREVWSTSVPSLERASVERFARTWQVNARSGPSGRNAAAGGDSCL